MSDAAYTIQLPRETLVFLTEMLMMSYLSALEMGARAQPCSAAKQAFISGTQELIENALRDLLRDPLRHSEFRQWFIGHFDSHPIDALREGVGDFLAEALATES